MIAIFKNNEFVKLSDNQEEINKYKIDYDCISYDIDFKLSIEDYEFYEWFLDINHSVKWYLKTECIATYEKEAQKSRDGYKKYTEKINVYHKLINKLHSMSFIQRLKFLFTGELECH